MLVADIGKADVDAHIAVQFKVNATFGQLVVAAHDHIFFQLETGDAVGQQTTRAVIAVIDGDLHTRAAQHIRRGQTTGARADDTNGFGAFGLGLDRLHPAIFPRGIGDVFLDRADGHSAVAGLFDHTVAFAQTVLRADAAADFGEGVCRLADLIGLLQTPFGGQAQPVGNIVVQRAMGLAIGNAALATAAGLLLRFLIRVFRINLFKVFTTQIRHPFFGHIPGYRCKLEHWLLCHLGSLRLKHVAAPSYTGAKRL